MTKQLTAEELQTVKECKIWGFAAFLQMAFIVCPELKRKMILLAMPSKQELQLIFNRTKRRKEDFDFVYFCLLMHTKNNPLQVEQKAWELLTVLVQKFLDDFALFINKYSPQQNHKNELAAHLDVWYDLIQKWNIISNCYKRKLDKMWDAVEEEEKKVEKLIQSIS